MIAEEIVDIEIEPTENILLNNPSKFPQTNFIEDDGPLPFPEEELISQDEFRRFLEKIAYERLGIKLNLPSSEWFTA